MVLRGKKNVLKNLAKSRILAEAATAAAVAQAAARVAREAKIFVPVDNGILQGSIKDEAISPMRYEVGSNEEYAPHVEFGTRHMRAQPYMQPAIDVVAKDFPKLIKGGLAVKLRGL